MDIHIQAFEDGNMIPQEYTCDGNDTIPTITITAVPKKATTLAFIIDDPDATNGSTWNHCVLYNIPPETREINKNNVQTFTSGLNSWGNIRYGGPCPPKGSNSHRYVFKLYALSKDLTLKNPPTFTEIKEKLHTYLLEQTSYTGLYGRD